MSFYYKNSKLYAEDVAVDEIIKKVGSPAYIYSQTAFENQYQAFDDAFKNVNHVICYSMKCNSNLSILKNIARCGGGVDIVSGGELYRALLAGVDAKKIVYSGVGKSRDEMQAALKAGILFFNIESEAELEILNEEAAKLKKMAPISIRVNPNIDPKTHPYISTGLKKAKFGVELHAALKLYQKAKKLKNIEIIGLDCHIGSQLTQVKPFIDSIKKLREMILSLKKNGIEFKYLDLGGGLGIRYKNENPPSLDQYAKAVIEHTRDLGLTLVFEPGRVIMGNAGILVTEVMYVKKSQSKNFVIVDAAMNDLIRPAFYGSYHAIEAIQKSKRKSFKADVVGPICESGDFFAQDRKIAEPKAGEHLAIFSAGAYGFAMSSNYNTRRRAVEVLVKNNQFKIIRKRESYEDLVKAEK